MASLSLMSLRASVQNAETLPPEPRVAREAGAEPFCWRGAVGWVDGCAACVGVGATTSPSTQPDNSSMSWVNKPELRVAESVASISPRFLACFRTVFQRPHGSSFSTLPTAWPMMAWSPSVNLAPQPPFLFQQSQPPPYSSLPLMMAAVLHSGQTRSALRQRNRP